jgi:hypothetical protein
MTWASDNNQYTSWGDGGGFGGTNSLGRVSLGVARIEGSPEAYHGINVWGGKDGETRAKFGGKSYGILAVKDVLYLWVSPGSGTENNTETRLAWSTDYGRHWERTEWAFNASDRIMVPTFCQFGPGYTKTRDDFVYIYSTRLLDAGKTIQRPGQVDLLRAPRGKLLERGAYETFAGNDSEGRPQWSSDLRDRAAIFQDASGTHRLSVSYHPRLRRYLMCIEHGRPYAGCLGIFDSPEPWGPWTTVEYGENWGGFGSTFFWCFPTKWFGDTGSDFTMVFTGTEENDAWNTVRGRFVVPVQRPATTPGNEQ